MFLGAAQLPILDYINPWRAGFEERLASLCRSKLRVAYFYESPDTSTFRYRVFNMVEALNATPECGVSASWFSLADAPVLRRFIDQADVLILCRTRYGPIVEEMLSRASRRQLPVLFDVDDLVFDPSYVALIVDSLNLDNTSERVWDYWFAYTGRMNATLRNCAGAITTNAYLANVMKKSVAGLLPRVVPNFLNRLQQQTSSAIWAAKVDSGFKRDSKLHVGYFSGTPSHNRDFQIASEALADLMDRLPNVVLRIVGFLDIKEPLTRYKDRIEHYPLQDFLNLQRLIGEVEVNMVPLQNNVFTNCKSELKYFEAAIAGTVTIASPTASFKDAIQDGQNGYLSAAHEWNAKLSNVVDTLHEPVMYSRMVERAHEQAEETYSWYCFAAQIKDAIFDTKRAGAAVSGA